MVSVQVLVYKISHRRARAWPNGRVRARAKISCIQDTFARARTRPMQPLGQARATTIGYLVYKKVSCIQYESMLVYKLCNLLEKPMLFDWPSFPAKHFTAEGVAKTTIYRSMNRYDEEGFVARVTGSGRRAKNMNHEK